MNPNLTLSSDYLHLANDNNIKSGTLSIPANASIPAGGREWTLDFAGTTQNGAFIIPYFEVSVPVLAGSKIFSYGFDLRGGDFVFILSVTKLDNGLWRLKVSAWGNYSSTITASNMAFTVSVGLRTLVVT